MVERSVRVLAWPAERKRLENPYTFLVQHHTSFHGIETQEFTLRNLCRFRWDILHVHWPDMAVIRTGRVIQVLRCTAIIVALYLHRLFGAKLVWTVHNVRPHEVPYPFIANLYYRCFVAMVDAIISPSILGLEQAQQAYPRFAKLPKLVARNGHYADEYGAATDRADARQKLGLPNEARVLLSFGLIRDYKNLPHLASLVTCADSQDLRLLIAGPNKDNEEVRRLTEIAADDNRITVRADYIPNEEIPIFFGACDLVVLPFKKILNSGSAVLALSMRRAVLAPNVGAIPELSELVGDEWLKTYDGSLSLDVVERALEQLPSPETSPDLKEFDWQTIGKDIADFFRSLPTRREDASS